VVELKKLGGKRILFKYFTGQMIYEARVVEVSPSGEFVKLRIFNGIAEREVWNHRGKIELLEVWEEE